MLGSYLQRFARPSPDEARFEYIRTIPRPYRLFALTIGASAALLLTARLLPPSQPELAGPQTSVEAPEQSQGPGDDNVAPSASCLDAARTVVVAEREIIRTHPGANEDAGDPVANDALQRELDAAFEPMYTACGSPADWWATAQEVPEMAGNLDAANLDPPFISGWCYDRVDGPPMCEDWEAWVESMA